MKPGVSLIISSYNQHEYLARVLCAISAQAETPDEVIVADDGSDDATAAVVESWMDGQELRCERVWQPNLGFRRARILNLALARVTQPYVVFLDGDSIPHPKFVSDHRRLACPGHFVQGHRALITRRGSEEFGTGKFNADRRRALWTGRVRGLKHVFRWRWPWRRVLNHVDGVRGCNLAAWTADLFEINGYNEEYFGWGCEDLDVALRLVHSGLKRLDVRGWALCYHLWHDPADRSNLASNLAVLARTKEERLVRCVTGLDQHLERDGSVAVG